MTLTMFSDNDRGQQQFSLVMLGALCSEVVVFVQRPKGNETDTQKPMMTIPTCIHPCYSH